MNKQIYVIVALYGRYPENAGYNVCAYTNEATAQSACGELNRFVQSRLKSIDAAENYETYNTAIRELEVELQNITINDQNSKISDHCLKYEIRSIELIMDENQLPIYGIPCSTYM